MGMKSRWRQDGYNDNEEEGMEDEEVLLLVFLLAAAASRPGLRSEVEVEVSVGVVVVVLPPLSPPFPIRGQEDDFAFFSRAQRRRPAGRQMDIAVFLKTAWWCFFS